MNEAEVSRDAPTSQGFAGRKGIGRDEPLRRSDS